MDKNSQLLEFLNAPDETLKKWCGVSLGKIHRGKPILKKGKMKLFGSYGGRAAFDGCSFTQVKREQALLKKFYRKMLHDEELSYEDIKVINNKLKDINPVLCVMEESVPGVFKEDFSKRRSKDKLQKVGFAKFDADVLSEDPKYVLYYLKDFEDLLTTKEIEEHLPQKGQKFINGDQKRKYYLDLHKLFESMEEPRKIKCFRLGWGASGFSGYWFELIREVLLRQTLPPECERCGFIIPISSKSSIESRQKKSKDKRLLCPRCRHRERTIKYIKRQKRKKK